MSGPSFQLILLAALLVPAILFFLTQQNTLKLIRKENRDLHPALVWLQIIPLFNLYWIFVVVTRIADGISKEKVALQDDSILGIPDYDAVKGVGKRPTYKIGMAWCILYLCFFGILIVFNLFATPNSTENDTFLAIFSPLFGLAITTCWIIYWVKLVSEKRKLTTLHP